MHAEYGGHYQYKPLSPSNTLYNYTLKLDLGMVKSLLLPWLHCTFTVGGVSVITVQKTVGGVN